MPRATLRPPRRRSRSKLPGMARALGRGEATRPVRSVSPPDPARPAQLREANCRTLLRLLRAAGSCSKADLVRGSGLSASTVSAAIATLDGFGLIEEMGDGASRGGRPAGLLRFKAEHGLVAAADVGGTRLRMMLADLNGVPVAQWAVHLGARQKTPRAVTALMETGLREMQKQAALTERGAGRLLHLAVGAPGITDAERGVVVAAPNLQGWDDLPLRAMLEREFPMGVSVENDTNLAALGEHARGVARDVEDFVFVAMGTGVGAGIVMRGALHHGASWTAGEIGYLPVAGLPREAARLHETGQLERTVGGAGIEAAWQKLLKRKRRAENAALMTLRAPQIFDLAEEGHALALEVLGATARILADAIGMLALIYDPRLVVLGGGVGSHRALCRATEALLQESEFARPALQASTLGTEAQLFGAVAVALAAAEDVLLC